MSGQFTFGFDADPEESESAQDQSSNTNPVLEDENLTKAQGHSVEELVPCLELDVLPD
jgi:hypothetical protein